MANESLSAVLSDGESSSAIRLSSPSASQYLSQLTTLSLPEILQEPTNLASEASQLANSLTSLCHSEYSTFLSLRQTALVLSNTFSSFSSSLSGLITALPELESQTRQFSDETASIQKARRKARLVLQQHDTLVDVLDIPQLIDTCVRNAYYQEAMDLATHAKSLADRFPDVALVQDVAAEADHATRVMLGQLLSLLREPAKLPALFKVVSFLRKMGTLGELELALTFLSSRLVSLTSTIDGIEKERIDHARYIRRYVDVWREGVHDVISQYTNIFLDRASSSDVANQLRYLLSTFTHSMITALIDILSVHLHEVEDVASLTSLLTQLTHCSTSFARVGLDFRTLLPPLFENAVTVRFTLNLDIATKKFVSTVSDAQKYSRPPSQVLVTPIAASSPPDDISSQDSARIAPHILASYPPLATYTNSLTAALNSLRLLAPIAVLPILQKIMDASLAKAASSFLTYTQVTIDGTAMKRSTSVDENAPDQSRILRTTGTVLVKVLIPFARKCLTEGVYGEEFECEAEGELKDTLLEWEKWMSSVESPVSLES